MAKDYRLEKRKFVIGGIALSIVLIYLVRLFVLQITTDDYKKNAVLIAGNGRVAQCCE